MQSTKFTFQAEKMAGAAGLEHVTSAVTGQRSNQLSYAPARNCKTVQSRQVNVRKRVRHVKWKCVKFQIDVYHQLVITNRQSPFAKLKNSGSRRQGGGGGEPR